MSELNENQDNRIPLVAFYGIPDDGRASSSLDIDNQLHFALPGTACFLQYLSYEKFRIQTLFLSHLKGNQDLPLLTEGVLVNMMSDTDIYSIALNRMNAVTQQLSLPCFNHPKFLSRIRRDQLPITLANIPNIIIPTTIRVIYSGKEALIVAILNSDLRFPIIIRIAGDHGGVSTVKLNQFSDIQKLDFLPVGGRLLDISNWMDYSDKDGLYRKHRIVMVSGKPVLRHVIIGNRWMLHHTDRIDTSESISEEKSRLLQFDTHVLPQIASTLEMIHQRIGLDFYGIDCHLADDGKMIIFEANPSMDTLANKPSPNCWDAPCAQILQNLEASLSILSK